MSSGGSSGWSGGSSGWSGGSSGWSGGSSGWSGGSSGWSGECDPDSGGGLYIEKPQRFKRKFVDRITSYRPECDQTLELNPYEWGINPDAGIRFISVRGKKQRRRAAKQDVDFIYEEKKGGLFFNENGSKKGFGDGGLFAILKGKPDLGIEHFEFDLNESDFY